MINEIRCELPLARSEGQRKLYAVTLWEHAGRQTCDKTCSVHAHIRMCDMIDPKIFLIDLCDNVLIRLFPLTGGARCAHMLNMCSNRDKGPTYSAAVCTNG